MREILEQLETMTEDELVFLYQEIEKRLRTVHYGEGQILYDEICQRIKGGKQVPLPVFMKGRYAGKFVKFTEEAYTLSKELRSPHFIMFCSVLIPAIIDFLEENNIPVTMNAIMNQSLNLKVILERSFPGYIESGLVYLIFGKGMRK